MKKLAFILAFAFICGIFVQLQVRKTNQIKQLQITNLNLKKQLDSLNSEIFVKDIQIQRYEYIMDRAEAEMSPECKEELENILKQTE